MATMFLPSNLAMDLDKYFGSPDGGGFTHEDFYNLVETLQSVGSEKNQNRTVEFFKKLPREEVISRARTVSRLSTLLQFMKTNRRHDISRSPTK